MGPIRPSWAQLDPDDYTAIAPSWTPAGAVTINTDNLTIDGVAGNGIAVTQPSGGPEIAVFTFDTIDIAAGVIINVTGSRALALLAQDAADNSFVMNGTINASGGAPGTPSGATAGPGGFRGGNGGVGLGAGASGSSGTGLGGGSAGGGGRAGGGGAGFGGAGGDAIAVSQFQNNNFGGLEHGNLLGIFHGGSGGGGGGSGDVGGATNLGSGGGGGGGAIELVSKGQLTYGGTINAFGSVGGAGSTGIRGGGAGGGSGGGVILAAQTLQQTGSIALEGGIGGRGTYTAPFMSGVFTSSGGGGGGGGRAVIRLPQFVFDQTNGLNLTNVNLGGGAGGSIISVQCMCAPPQVKAGQPGQPGAGLVLADELVIPADESLTLAGAPEYTSPDNADFEIRADSYRVEGTASALTLDGITQAIQGVHVANGGQANVIASSLALGANSINGDGSAGSSIHYAGTTVVNGKLKGATTHTIDAHASPTVFNTTLINAGANVQQNGATTFNSVANGGTIFNNANTLGLVGGFNAGTLHVNNQVNISDDWFNSGRVHVAAVATLDNTGNDLVNTGRIYVGTPVHPGGVIQLNGTTLRNDGTIHNNGSINGDVVNGPDGVLTGGGAVNGNVENAALVSPGNSPGALSINGDYIQTAEGELLIELASVSSFDRLLVSGQAALDGTLDVETINGFEPALPGESFAIMNYGSHSGTFDAIIGQPAPLLPGLFWTVEYTATQAILSATAIPGDINLDGLVNALDAALFTPHLGTEANSIWTTGDFDGDAATTLDDLALLQSNFGATFPSPGGSLTAVPEPAGLIWALIGAVAVMYAARRANCGSRRSRATQA